MKQIAAVLLYVYLAIVACTSLYFATQLDKVPDRPSCQVAEISPDFSTEHREWCRTRRHKL